MYARVIRFTDANAERIADTAGRVEEGEGPPPDVPSKGLKVLLDEDQQTAVVIMFFETEEDMKKANETLDAMDASETPGTRASVDQGELKIDVEM